MAYFYVKDDGTAESGTATGDGGRYASAKSGDWSAAFSGTTEYYASIGAANAATTPPATGDYILVSDLHSKAYDNGANITFVGGSVEQAGIKIISVDDTAIDEYKPGATEHLTDTGDDYISTGNLSIYGISLETGDNVIQSTVQAVMLYAQDCTLTSDDSDDVCIFLAGDSNRGLLKNVTLNSNTAGVAITLTGGSRLEWNGGALTGTFQYFITDSSFAYNGGATIILNGVDLSAFTGTLIPTIVAGSTDNFLVRLNNCKLSDSLTALHATLSLPSHRFEMFNTDDSSDAYHRFYVADGAGSAANNDSTYVTATESWYEGSTKSSIEVITTALCSNSVPFIFELPSQYVDLGNTSTDVVSVELLYDANDITLVDTDIAAFLVYPDGTTMVQGNLVTSSSSVASGSYAVDPLATGSALTAATISAGSWTETMTTPTAARLKLDTSADAGEATAVSVRIEVYQASIAAGDLFIHPLLTVAAT